MIYRKKEYYEKINNLKKNNFEIVSDFDRTITSSSSLTTWGILNHRGILPNEYDFERNSLYNYYRPIEVDPDIDEAVKLVAMEDWQEKHLELLKKYGLNKEQICELFTDKDVMSFRDGFLDFYNYINDNDIRINIISGGIGDFALNFLDVNNCSFTNLDMKSNFLKFDRNGTVIGFKDAHINSLNKHEYAFDIDTDYIILIGDQISDIMMCKNYQSKNIISIAFVPDDNMNELETFKDVYDMVLTSDESFKVILDDLKKVIG